MKKILLSTLPLEGEFVNWTTPDYYLAKPSKLNYMPLGLLSLATNLREGYKIVILDPPSEGWGIEETVLRIEKEKPDILGLSVVSQRAYAMKKILQKTTTHYKVVGGPHATHYAKQILNCGADAVFIGQLADLEFGEAVDTEPKGVVYCKSNINEIKFPDRKFLNVENYFPKDFILFKAKKRLPIFTSVGCPYRCVFCDVQTKKPQWKLPKYIVDEMEYLFSIGARSIHFLDDNFNINERYLNKIIDEIEERHLSVEWSGRGRPQMSEELMKRLVDNNFKRMHIGIESFSDQILQYLGKMIKADEIFKFCHSAKKYNIDLVSYFIFGTPHETEEYLRWFPQKIKELGIKHPYFNILFPAPNTEYYKQLLRDGVYPKDYWADFMENPTADFHLPFPYGKRRYDETASYVTELIKIFK